MSINTLIRVLEVSIHNNGSHKELTLGHFLNILKKVREVESLKREKEEKFKDELMTVTDSNS
jgi:hypothetical protein